MDENQHQAGGIIMSKGEVPVLYVTSQEGEFKAEVF